MEKSLLLLIFALLSLPSISQNCTSLRGGWINELGSVLQIDSVTFDGQILGLYKSSSGVDGRIFPLQGWINSSSDQPEEINITFSVIWGRDYGSITSWTGYCYAEGGKSKIKTIWHLVRSGKDFDWERIITNSSVFISAKER